MSLAFKQISVYTKLILVLIVALAVGTVLVKNRNSMVTIWFFGLVESDKPINVLWLLLCTAVGSVVCWWVFLKALHLVREMREVAQEKQARKATELQEQRARELTAQEERIDER